MHPFVTAQLMVGAILLSVGVLYGVIAAKGYRRSVTLPFALACFFGAVAPVGEVHPMQIFAVLFGVFGIAYLLWTCVRLWRRGERRRAVSFGFGLAPLFFVAYPHGLLVNRGILLPPYLYLFSLLSLVLIMNWSLGKEALRSEVLAEESNRTRGVGDRYWKVFRCSSPGAMCNGD